MPHPLPSVKVGQVWKDNDKRMADRYLKVLQVFDKDAGSLHGYVQVQQVKSSAAGTNAWAPVAGSRPRNVAIKRMVPTSTGYHLILDVSAFSANDHLPSVAGSVD